MKVVALTGLTECGKAAAADHLRKRGFLKVKIGDILEHVYEEDGADGDFQNWNFTAEAERPTWLMGRFLHFLRAHVNEHQKTACTIDSLYGPVMGRYLLEKLGDDFLLLFIESDVASRIDRQMATSGMRDREAAAEIIRQKDADKTARGTLDLLQLPHQSIQNNGTLDQYHSMIDAAIDQHYSTSTANG